MSIYIGQILDYLIQAVQKWNSRQNFYWQNKNGLMCLHPYWAFICLVSSSVREPCQLHCVAETYNYVFTIKHTAIDGMKCNSGGVCVDGVCTVSTMYISTSVYHSRSLWSFYFEAHPFLSELSGGEPGTCFLYVLFMWGFSQTFP